MNSAHQNPEIQNSATSEGTMRTELGGFTWTLADPFDTQERDFTDVPDKIGLYLWLRRATPGMNPGATDDVLYVGKSKRLRDRLHRYSATKFSREEPVLRALFDRVIAPCLDPEQLRQLIVERKAPGIAQMWVRDHVVFAWTLWDQPKLGTVENQLRSELRPWFNGMDAKWTKYNSTTDADQSLTRSICPSREWALT
jgi:hypothetical protein